MGYNGSYGSVANRSKDVMPRSRVTNVLRKNIRREERSNEDSKIPDFIKGFQSHGVDIDYQKGTRNLTADCPFCGREGKFSVESETGKWRCFVCNEGNQGDRGYNGGNLKTFIRFLWKRSNEQTEDYGDLAKDRGYLYPDSLMHWGIAKSITTSEWIIPGFSLTKKLDQLYRYVWDRLKKKHRLYATIGLGHRLFGMDLFDPKKPNVYICEGVWDAIALWEILGKTRIEEGRYIPTSNHSISLLATSNVLGVPGANVFDEEWCSILKDKTVFLLYHNDHPRKHPVTGQTLPPAGLDGMKRAVEILASSEAESGSPKEIRYLQWGKDGEEYNGSLKSGYDVRDFLTSADNHRDRSKLLGELLEKLKPIPADWKQGRTKLAEKKGSVEMKILPCEKWSILTNQFRKAMKWTEGLDRAFSIMLACVTSTNVLGDQLWCKVIAPAGSGKTTLCRALATNKKYVIQKSIIKGFHSGFKMGSSRQDNSLIAEIAGKTLVTKDADTLLKIPNRDQVLSEARDLFDTTSSSYYKNKMGKDYEGVRMTWIICGTFAIKELDNSDLGERFIDIVLMDKINEEEEEDILWRVINRTDRGLSKEANCKTESQDDPDMVKAYQLTGGYINYLRKNAAELLEEVHGSEERKRECIQLGKFIAYMRAKPSKRQEDVAEREFAARLVSQMWRLAKCLAVVLNRKSVDDEVMRRVRKVATDTAMGRTIDIAKHLYKEGRGGLDLKSICHLTGNADQKERNYLKFLKKIGVVENFSLKVPNNANGSNRKSRIRWRLTKGIHELYHDVMVIQNAKDTRRV